MLNYHTMSKHDEKEITSEEIKKEFQLERMVLFSDAVLLSSLP